MEPAGSDAASKPIARGEVISRRAFVGTAAALGIGLVGTACSRAGGTSFPAGPPVPRARALLLVLADTHSAYERYPQIVSAVDRVLAAHPGVPAALLFNGDLFERGNVVSLRSGARPDLALVQALSARVPVVFNLGNHEGALEEVATSVRRLADRGAQVIGNLRDASTGRMLAPPSASLDLGGRRVLVAGIGTSDMATYRAAIRDSLLVQHGPRYAAEHLPSLFRGADTPVLLTHEGTRDDRDILRLVPDGSLVVGGHDHLQYEHRPGRTLYLHPGHWAGSLTVVVLADTPAGERWVRRSVRLDEVGQGESALASVVRETERTHLTAAELEPVGTTARPYAFAEAAVLAASAVRDAAGADLGLIGNTTFGAGLPGGVVTRHRFDAFVRFDNPVVIADLEGGTVRRILAGANQFQDVPFDHRSGEYLVASPIRNVRPGRTYRVATDGWIRVNAMRYLGMVPDFGEVPGLRLKAAVEARLQR